MFENKDQGPKRTEYGIVQLVYTVYYIPYILVQTLLFLLASTFQK